MLSVDGLALAWARAALSARRFVRDALRGVACVAALVAAGVLSPVPIEAVQVGDRVLTPGTAATGAELPTEVDPATWARVRYVVDDGAGARDLLLVDALLPLGEIERLGLGTPGAAVIADGEEAMPAWVVDVLPCPRVASGPGAVVLTTYSHLAAELLELRLPGGDRIGLTPDQYLLSADADGWVAADVVRAGDRLRTAGGDAALASVKVARETAWVHDLEVESEHAYLVGEAGLVAHNSDCIDRVRKVNNLPGNAKPSANEADIFSRLEQHNGIDPNLASERLHAIKEAEGLRPRDNVIFGRSGDVFHPSTGEHIGSLTKGGAK